MILKHEDGSVGELIQWNLSYDTRLHVLVKLPNGNLEEWAIQDCRVVEESELAESPDTAKKNIIDEINDLRVYITYAGDEKKSLDSILNHVSATLQKLSIKYRDI